MPHLEEYAHVQMFLENDNNVINELIPAERSYAVNDLDGTLSTLHHLNEDQRNVYDTVVAAIDRSVADNVDDVTPVADLGCWGPKA